METMQRRAGLLSPSFLLRLNFASETIFYSRSHPTLPPLSPLGLTLKRLGLAWFGVDGGCFTKSVSSQLFLKNTITNMIAPTWGSVLRWKMRYKIYLRFLVFDKIESSHFNCSRLGVLLQAMETGALYVVPCSPQTIMFHCAKMPIMICFILVIYLI